MIRTMTKLQQQSCFKLWNNSAKTCPHCGEIIPNTHPRTYRRFRKEFKLFDAFGNNRVGSYFGGYLPGTNLFVGIENDGYTHS